MNVVTHGGPQRGHQRNPSRFDEEPTGGLPPRRYLIEQAFDVRGLFSGHKLT